MTTDQPDLVTHLRAHALKTDGPYTLRSGEVSSWYLDARSVTFSGDGARIIGAAVLDHIDETVEAVGGLTMGADPVALATAICAAGRDRRLDAFSIRKQTKAHGTGGRLVGPVRRGSRVAVLEDTTTTGGAFIEAVDVAEAEGLVIVQAVALIDRSGGRVADRMHERAIPYTAVVVPADLGVAE